MSKHRRGTMERRKRINIRNPRGDKRGGRKSRHRGKYIAILAYLKGVRGIEIPKYD